MSTGKNIPLPPFPELKQQSAHTCHTLTHHFKWFCCHNTKQSIWKEKHMEPQGRVKCFTHAAAYGFRPFYFFLSLKDSQLLSWAEWLSDLADLFLTCCGLPTTAVWRAVSYLWLVWQRKCHRPQKALLLNWTLFWSLLWKITILFFLL